MICFAFLQIIVRAIYQSSRDVLIKEHQHTRAQAGLFDVSHMGQVRLSGANAAAAMEKTKLSATDAELLQKHALATHTDYCAGCTGICESAIAEKAPIGDVMRYLMYCRSYGDKAYATSEFRKIPPKIRARLTGFDYSPAEKKCPQKMPIARLMREAADELS